MPTHVAGAPFSLASIRGADCPPRPKGAFFVTPALIASTSAGSTAAEENDLRVIGDHVRFRANRTLSRHRRTTEFDPKPDH
jgi:hypothetical protein